MNKSVKQLEIDIKNVQNQKLSTSDDADRFADVMSQFVLSVSIHSLIKKPKFHAFKFRFYIKKIIPSNLY